MNQILYYPYINLPRTDWTLRTLLYYDNVGSIVPQEFFYRPQENYDPFMLELVRENLVTAINPIEVLENPRSLKEPFIDFIKHHRQKLAKANDRYPYATTRIHHNKFDDEIFDELAELGLSSRIDETWFAVERTTANQLMKYLATLVAAKTDRIPTTDYVKPKHWRNGSKKDQAKRETILDELIPFPKDIDLGKLLSFKEKHIDLLARFRNEVEEISLDPHIRLGTDLFTVKLEKLADSRTEIAARMNEGKFKHIIFGSVCGLISAVQALPSGGTVGAMIGALPGFVSAVYSALQIERAEDIVDQTGLKYLALMDKRIRS